ncbi:MULTISPECIES: Holliday junction resolvase RuvX [unclassified Psychrobacter]|uniref:Holliday junction resolvase RuvX n=1 Tax=unclassified Psychrobacter TaxID=196806 RepID=UPI000AFFE1F3|nr:MULTISPECIES: Holliday junction resolvase RuvX [unclassified Psychrobacter]|tara:strand:+ start:11477 stop:12052 length:576 start_codon:yes stop_codon:yes gene_type:complete
MVDSTFTASSTDAIDNDIDIDTLDNGSNSTAETIEPEVKPHLILALDYGVKKMGMALGNNITQTARAFDILAMNNGQPDWDNLIGIIKVWGVAQVVVGLPLNMDGTSSMLSKRAHKFARRLAHRIMEQHLPVTVSLCDERLTSIEAREIAWDNGWIKNERDPIDDISACILMSTYFADPNSSIAIDAIKAE